MANTDRKVPKKKVQLQTFDKKSTEVR